MDETHLTKADNAHLDKRFDEIMDELRKINGALLEIPMVRWITMGIANITKQ